MRAGIQRNEIKFVKRELAAGVPVEELAKSMNVPVACIASFATDVPEPEQTEGGGPDVTADAAPSGEDIKDEKPQKPVIKAPTAKKGSPPKG